MAPARSPPASSPSTPNTHAEIRDIRTENDYKAGDLLDKYARELKPDDAMQLAMAIDMMKEALRLCSDFGD